MAGRFDPAPGGGAAVELDEVEISILRSLTLQLAELIGPGEDPAESDDPLASLFTEGPSEPPSDPALRRLFPDAYGDPEEDGKSVKPGKSEKEAHELRGYSAEFRRFTENDLRGRKRTDALAVIRTLDGVSDDGSGGGLLKLTPDQSQQWLGTLNDLRLTIGTRLEVTDEDEGGELYRLPDSDPRKPMVMAYLWLGALQETLIETLMP